MKNNGNESLVPTFSGLHFITLFLGSLPSSFLLFEFEVETWPVPLQVFGYGKRKRMISGLALKSCLKFCSGIFFFPLPFFCLFCFFIPVCHIDYSVCFSSLVWEVGERGKSGCGYLFRFAHKVKTPANKSFSQRLKFTFSLSFSRSYCLLSTELILLFRFIEREFSPSFCLFADVEIIITRMFDFDHPKRVNSYWVLICLVKYLLICGWDDTGGFTCCSGISEQLFAWSFNHLLIHIHSLSQVFDHS